MKKCRHKNIYPDYIDGGKCGTPHCEWEESHCSDCGRFIVKCGCGCWNGEDGWPLKRHLKLERIENELKHR